MMRKIRMYRIFSAKFLLFSLGLVSCDVFTSYDDKTGIDSRIIGEWYYINTYASGFGPPEYISGIQIRENGQVYQLAIETATGQLSISSKDSIGRIDKAIDNHVTYRSYRRGMMLENTYNSTYELAGDTLFFNYSRDEEEYIPLNNFYINSELGAQLTDPVLSSFQIQINDTEFINAPISTAPSAYAHYDLENNLIIKAIGAHQNFHVMISAFEGVGNYDINTVSISYIVWSGDEGYGITTEEDSSAVDLRIHQIEEQVEISGELFFNIGIIQFSYGDFSIPIY